MNKKLGRPLLFDCDRAIGAAAILARAVRLVISVCERAITEHQPSTIISSAHAKIEVHHMIARYTRPEMGAIWSEDNKYRCWLEVELAASEALAELGEVPADAAAALRQNADFQLSRIQEIESEVRHDVIAFTTAVAEVMKDKGAGDASRWLHYGLTSNDVVDTAQALQIRAASTILANGLADLSSALKTSAFKYKDTYQVGRTHGIHAEP